MHWDGCLHAISELSITAHWLRTIRIGERVEFRIRKRGTQTMQMKDVIEHPAFLTITR